MSIFQSDAFRNARADLRTSLADAGSGSAKLEIYSGAKPSTIGGTPAGDLICTFTMASPIAGAASGGLWEATVPDSVEAVAEGVPGHAVLKDSDDTAIENYDARLSTATDNGEEVVVTISGGGTSIASGATVSLSSYAMTEGNAQS